MKNVWKKGLMFCLGGMLMASSVVGAHPIRTPEGNMPMVHWAVLESTPGTMQAMGAIGAKTVGPQTAKANGVTKAEMVEAITQLGFYAGWPKAWGAFRMAKEVYEAK